MKKCARLAALSLTLALLFSAGVSALSFGVSQGGAPGAPASSAVETAPASSPQGGTAFSSSDGASGDSSLAGSAATDSAFAGSSSGNSTSSDGSSSGTSAPESSAPPAPADPGAQPRVANMAVTASLSRRNVVTVEEVITLDFTAGTAAFNRVLPLRFDISRIVGGQAADAPLRPLLSDVTVDGLAVEPVETKTTATIPISAAGAVNGKRTYTLAYTFDLGADGISEFDDIFYSFTWGSLPQTDKLSFAFTLPAAADLTDLRLFMGVLGETASGGSAYNAGYTVDGLTIKGTVGAMPAGRSLTLYLKVPDGYFKGARTLSPWPLIAAVAAMAAAIAVLFGLGRRPVKQTAGQQYPPQGVTPAAAGYLMNKTVGRAEVISLLLWLAEEGCLTMQGYNRNILVQRSAPLPADAPPYLAGFYNTLFAGGDTLAFSDMARWLLPSSELLQLQLPGYFRGRRRLISPFITIISILVAVAAPLAGALAIGYSGYNLAPMIWVFAALYGVFALCSAAVLWHITRPYRGLSTGKRALGAALCAGAAVLAVAMGYFAAAYSALSVAVTTGLALLATLTALFAARLHRPSPYAEELLAQVRGLRAFMQAAGVEEVGALLAKNPNYCYALLPWAYLFGIEKKWAALFDTLDEGRPLWYTGDGAGFTVRSLVENMAGALEGVLKASRKIARRQRKGKYDALPARAGAGASAAAGILPGPEAGPAALPEESTATLAPGPKDSRAFTDLSPTVVTHEGHIPDRETLGAETVLAEPLPAPDNAAPEIPEAPAGEPAPAHEGPVPAAGVAQTENAPDEKAGESSPEAEAHAARKSLLARLFSGEKKPKPAPAEKDDEPVPPAGYEPPVPLSAGTEDTAHFDATDKDAENAYADAGVETDGEL